ncbi:MAG: chemotaxis protein, partial [Clostridium sp. SCN 57-10]
NNADTLLYEDNTLSLQYAGNAATYYQLLRYNVAEMIILQDELQKETYAKKFENFVTMVQQNLDLYDAGIIEEEDRALFDTVSTAWKEYKSYAQEMTQLTRSGDYDGVKDILTGKADAVGTQVQDSIAKLVVYNENGGEKRSNSNTTQAYVSAAVMAAAMLAGMIAAILLAMFISRTISKPVAHIVDAANKLAQGDIEVEVDIATKDEMGTLAHAFAGIVENIRGQAYAAERIAEGDLTVDVSIRSEHDLLGKKLRELVEKNNVMLSGIASAADQVATGAKQVSDSSILLSQGATEQASAIEQLTAAIEEIASQTKQNAEYAGQANGLARDAKTYAERGNTQMAEMLTAMRDINNSSNNISKIIKVIEDIAFQTNILALNAAVEAARAGQHGKGFAVVAEEVRNLAARSANAAKETTDMIESSIQKVEGGTKIANATAEALSRIVSGIDRMASLVGDISTASNEQAAGIAQVNAGVTQVAQVVQTNSATSEESAAASEELSSQAQLLREQVGSYKLKQDEGHAPEQGYAAEVMRMFEAKRVQDTSTHDNQTYGNFGKY